MAWEFHVLVVANLTATSEELLAALRERAKRDACRFTLLTPRSGPESVGLLKDALEAMREAGLEKVDGHMGDRDPIVAVMEIWDPREFDEIIVSTLPDRLSRWLHADFPHRIGHRFHLPVTHVAAGA